VGAPRNFPLLVMLFCAAGMLATAWLWPGWRLVVAPLRVLGTIAFLSGVVLVLVAAGMFRRRRTTLHPYGESNVLVTAGLYRISRNPMYLGMLLMLTGLALALGHALAWMLVPLFGVLVMQRNIRHEERALATRFGDAYLAYCARVRRWI